VGFMFDSYRCGETANVPVEQQQGFFASTLSYSISQFQPAC
jgi:hypothetical protein